MASHPVDPRPALPFNEWHSAARVSTRSQLMACLRAVVIALVLLVVLALIVLY